MKKLSRVEKKMRRRRFLFRFILLNSLILLLCVLALNSNFFVINNIKVIGNKKISRDNIISASSIQLGENIFKINTRVGKRDLMKLPYVKEVKIERKFPKGIIIHITERKEIMQIKEISSFVLVDIDGYILDTVDTQNEDLPLLVGLKIEDKKPGDNLFINTETKSTVEFITEGHATKLLPKMKEIHMEDNNKVNITLINGISVAFGTLDNVKYKVNYLDEILKDIEKDKIPCKMILMDRGDNPIAVLEEEGEG